MKIESLIKVLGAFKLQNQINQQMETFGQCEKFHQEELDRLFNKLDDEEMDLFLDIMLKQKQLKEEIKY